MNRHSIFVAAVVATCLISTSSGLPIVESLEPVLDRVCEWIVENYTLPGIKGDCVFPISGCDFNFTGQCVFGYGSDTTCGCNTNTSKVDRSVAVMMSSVAASQSSNFKEAVCRTAGIEEGFRAAYANVSSLSNIYAGFPSGAFRMWPAYSWARADIGGGCFGPGICPDFDPRKRPWYWLAAAGPLDVVLLIDVSAQMAPQDRLAKARAAMVDVVASLQDSASHLQVVAFGTLSDVTVAGNGQLLRLNATGAGVASAFINSLTVTGAIGLGNITGAFERAFQILDQSRTAGESAMCRTAIICISSTPDDLLLGQVTDSIAAWPYGADTAPPVFMFTADGAGAAVMDQHKQVSCATGGIWKPLPDASEAHTFVGTVFTTYFSAGLMETSAVWSELYIDASGLGLIITAAKACRWKMTVPPKLLAVVATDFALSSWPDFTPEVVANLSSISKRCLSFELNKYDIEELRGDTRCLPSFSKVFVGVSVAVAFAVIAVTSIVLFCSTRIGKSGKIAGGVEMDPADEHARH